MEGLAEVATPFFEEISDFLLRCNPVLVLRTITNLESGISVWIQDQQGILSSRRDGAQAEAVKKLWTTVCSTILSGEQPQLESFEMLLCAGFESKHRQIVNTAAEAWNRVFEAAGDVQYPERLKAVLLSSHARSTPKSRLRHDDSQLHFTPVESSPLAGAQESQVLTERQQEVRERQKDAAAIFPGLRSSPLRHEAAAQQSSSKVTAAEGRKQRQRDVTPEGRAEEEEYVISTPTPRRGQALAMIVDDQDMTDPPSSPPEPRPFPLLPHLKTRSSLGEVDQDWPMSSSPVNGSPVVSKEHAAANEIPILDITGGENHNPSSLDTHGSDMIIDDSFQMEVVPSSVASEARLPTHRKEVVVIDDDEAEEDDDEPSTPRARDDVDDAKSDEPDVFVDALTSPQQPLTRSAKKALERQADAEKDGSFVMSDGDENSMLRLVVELDSRRCKLPINRHPAESPSKHEDIKEVLDCITVVAPEDGEDEEDEAKEKPRRKSKSKSRSPGRSQSVVEMSAPPPASETSSKKKKRKRSAAAREESTNKKAKPSQEGLRSRQTSVLTDRSVASSFCSDSHAGDAEGPSSPGHPSTPAKETRAHKASVTPRRRSRRIYSDEKDTDTELESQLAAEQIAASRSQSLAVEEAVALSTSVSREASMDLSHDVTPRASQSVAIPTVEEDEEEDKDESQKPTMLDSLTGVLAQLKSATLSRDEVYKMEDVLMDIKRELFAAEKRGRA
ncbi:hypothetical protein HYQ45_009165 [Verticillium longisporum]|uniref:Telomere-associated protein Rif1 N-terminal domain-containing protein n=1 Tax=Verticillium longisporum TaxID=100787 RepID=A0A8I2ZKC2_VERLO|nr:hypothetical protein HYQ45_009165 [Verticillium longisporum]